MGFRDQIRQEAISRRIPYLAHFTQMSNVPSIIENGLLSRADLLAGGVDSMASAQYRLDDEDGALSVSVTAMNYEMFKAKQKAAGRAAWVVLLLDRSILWTHACKFLFANAARNEMKRHRGRLDGPWAFSRMFSDELRPRRFSGTSYRAETCIPECLTTRPEAEVQVFGAVPATAILHAWIDRHDHAGLVQEQLSRILDGRERTVTVQEFAPRFANDFAQWG